MGCGSGMPAGAAYRRGSGKGCGRGCNEVLAKLHEADRIDWSRAVIDSSHLRAVGGRAGRSELRARGIRAAIPRPKQAHGSGLGKQRWVVERTIAWPHNYRRLRVREPGGEAASGAVDASPVNVRLLGRANSKVPCPLRRW
jgi:hypothetical protein